MTPLCQCQPEASHRSASYDSRMSVTSVVVVDDHRMVAEGLATLLATDAGIDVVGQAATLDEALALVADRDPDVAVVDLRLADTDGVSVALALRVVVPELRVVLISAGFTRPALRGAVEAGITAFASKLAPAEELVRVVRAAAAGETTMTSDVAPILVGSEGAPSGTPSLTARECDVLQGLAEGLTVDELAARLFLSPHTVRNHIRRAMTSLGVHRRLDAVVTAARAGLIELPE